MKKALLLVIALPFLGFALFSLVGMQANQTNFPGTGTGTVNANNGTVGAVATYATNGGSTTVGPDATLVDNGLLWLHTLPIQLPVGTGCAAPFSITGTGMAATTGLFLTTTAAEWCTGGTRAAGFTASGVGIASSKVLALSSTTTDIGAVDAAVSRLAPNIVALGANSTAGNTGAYLAQLGAVRVPSGGFTTANNTSLQAITGLTWTVPASAANYSYHCGGAYSQATGLAAVAFGIQAVTNSPTNIFGAGTMYIGATSVQDGVLATLATTTATAIVTGTPAGTGVNTTFYLDGTIENPALANTFTIMVSTATGTDPVTVLRGTTCQLWVTGS